jgi:peptide deformylase
MMKIGEETVIFMAKQESSRFLSMQNLSSKKGEEWDFNEGCLSVPTIREDITRPDEVHISVFMMKTFYGAMKCISGFTRSCHST